MSTEMTQVPGAAAAQPNTQQPQAAQPTAGQPAAEQPKNDSPAATPANPTAGQSATLSAPAEPPAAVETSWFEDETLGLSNRTWCEIIGGVAVAATAYFVGTYMAGKSDDAPAV